MRVMGGASAFRLLALDMETHTEQEIYNYI